MRMNEEEYKFYQSRGLLCPPRKPSPVFNTSNPDIGFYLNQSISQKQLQASQVLPLMKSIHTLTFSDSTIDRLSLKTFFFFFKFCFGFLVSAAKATTTTTNDEATTELSHVGSQYYYSGEVTRTVPGSGSTSRSKQRRTKQRVVWYQK